MYLNRGNVVLADIFLRGCKVGTHRGGFELHMRTFSSNIIHNKTFPDLIGHGPEAEISLIGATSGGKG